MYSVLMGPSRGMQCDLNPASLSILIEVSFRIKKVDTVMIPIWGNGVKMSKGQDRSGLRSCVKRATETAAADPTVMGPTASRGSHGTSIIAPGTTAQDLFHPMNMKKVLFVKWALGVPLRSFLIIACSIPVRYPLPHIACHIV